MMLAGVIIAGGNASRMDNAEKPLALLRGRPLVDYVVERTRPQVNALALNVKEEVGALYRDTAAKGLPLLVDRFGGEVGPLGGVLAGLEWATACGSDWL
ncbi:MAG TPA: molybdenum cofactor guanylyltransferase MobA, partial [Rhodobiaceae bacterium]|nr:molybdenum cofactor guanylyltransferase MobA [Rhodobiaceae bacterium]